MNQSETVAFWIGLIGSIVGIVLAIVAIVFSILVDRRSSKISDHTIQSLQKIESAVERLSSDTRELIKAGWDKMLGNVDRAATPTSSESAAKEVAAGIAAELRSELTTLSTGKGARTDKPQLQVDQLEKYLKNLEASLMAQLRVSQTDARPSAKFEEILATISELTKPTHALLRAIRNAHLTKTEYKRLSEGRFGPSLLELRRAGLLVPVVHRTNHGSEPCYYLPPGVSKIARAALQVLPEPPKDMQHEVAAELELIGYPSGSDDPHTHKRGDDSPETGDETT